ncbi:MAG: hypothetical protein OET90_02935, partial [Desulfuromonadales bacterium]|nr:hypothetical protein [Desulfuromonadales bacterium]
VTRLPTRRLIGLLLLLLLPASLCATTLEGRVMLGDEPLPGIIVSAHPDLDFTSTALAHSKPSDDEGYYQLELPAGSYGLYGWNADHSHFAFCGRNPVNIKNESIWAGLQAVRVTPASSASYDDDYSAAIEGKVLYNGEPVTGAYVYLYLDVAEDLKGQGYRLSLPTDDDGYFRFDGLPESDYFVLARKRDSGQRVGPVREGDLFGVYAGNPLTATAGATQQIELPTVAKLKQSSGSETFGRATGPQLRGVVTNTQGQGVAAVHVFAYVDRVIGHQRPAAISPPTGEDGRFIINLPQAGVYYIGAREEYGDSPAPGELFGMYEASADHGLKVDAQSAKQEIEITVEPIEIY